MKTKRILTYLMIGLQTMLFSQNKTFANIDFGHAPDCFGYSGICTFQSIANIKSIANAEIIFTLETSEISLIFNKKELDANNRSKLLEKELEKGLFQYQIDSDFILPNHFKEELNIQELSVVKQGNYLVKVEGELIVMKLKLE